MAVLHNTFPHLFEEAGGLGRKVDPLQQHPGWDSEIMQVTPDV